LFSLKLLVGADGVLQTALTNPGAIHLAYGNKSIINYFWECWICNAWLRLAHGVNVARFRRTMKFWRTKKHCPWAANQGFWSQQLVKGRDKRGTFFLKWDRAWCVSGMSTFQRKGPVSQNILFMLY